MGLLTGKVKQVQSAGNPWKNKHGDDMYPWEIYMEDESVGYANTKSADASKAWPVGEEVTYNVEKNDKGDKFQRVYDNPPKSSQASSSTSLVDDPTRDSIERQTALKAAVEFCKDRLELKTDDVVSCSDKFINWIQKK